MVQPTLLLIIIRPRHQLVFGLSGIEQKIGLIVKVSCLITEDFIMKREINKELWIVIVI